MTSIYDDIFNAHLNIYSKMFNRFADEFVKTNPDVSKKSLVTVWKTILTNEKTERKNALNKPAKKKAKAKRALTGYAYFLKYTKDEYKQYEGKELLSQMRGDWKTFSEERKKSFKQKSVILFEKEKEQEKKEEKKDVSLSLPPAPGGPEVKDFEQKVESKTTISSQILHRENKDDDKEVVSLEDDNEDISSDSEHSVEQYENIFDQFTEIKESNEKIVKGIFKEIKSSFKECKFLTNIRKHDYVRIITNMAQFNYQSFNSADKKTQKKIKKDIGLNTKSYVDPKMSSIVEKILHGNKVHI